MPNTQKKHKFNAVDAAIIIVIVAIIGTAIFFFAWGNDDKIMSAPQTFDIEYVIEFRNIRDEFTDNFKIGDKVSDAAALSHIGEIVAVEVTDATYNGTNLETGELVISDYPDYSIVSVTVSAEASTDSLGRFIVGEGYDIAIGKPISIRTPNYTGTAYCTQIRQIEGGAQ